MYNTGQYNSFLYNGSASSGAAVASDEIIFNNYSLQNAEIISRDLIDNMPGRDFQTQAVPRNDGEFVLGDFWRQKAITIRGVIVKDTASELLAELDAMKKACSQLEGTLDIKVDGVYRRFEATLVSGDSIFAQKQHYHITFMPFELTFATVEPFGHSIDYVANTFLSETSLELDETMTNNGSARAKPVVVLNVVSASGVSEISFKNNTRDEEIVLTETISTGDYVRFDSEEMEVTINSVVQDYSGGFPLLNPGANSITIDITGTSISYDLTLKHKTSYL